MIFHLSYVTLLVSYIYFAKQLYLFTSYSFYIYYIKHKHKINIYSNIFRLCALKHRIKYLYIVIFDLIILLLWLSLQWIQILGIFQFMYIFNYLMK